MEYSFARCGHLIEHQTFGGHVTESLVVGTQMGMLVRNINWVLTLVNLLPENISGRWVPGEHAKRPY